MFAKMRLIPSSFWSAPIKMQSDWIGIINFHHGPVVADPLGFVESSVALKLRKANPVRSVAAGITNCEKSQILNTCRSQRVAPSASCIDPRCALTHTPG